MFEYLLTEDHYKMDKIEKDMRNNSVEIDRRTACPTGFTPGKSIVMK